MERQYCIAIVKGRGSTPAHRCHNTALPGSEYCGTHIPKHDPVSRERERRGSATVNLATLRQREKIRQRMDTTLARLAREHAARGYLQHEEYVRDVPMRGVGAGVGAGAGGGTGYMPSAGYGAASGTTAARRVGAPAGSPALAASRRPAVVPFMSLSSGAPATGRRFSPEELEDIELGGRRRYNNMYARPTALPSTSYIDDSDDDDDDDDESDD